METQNETIDNNSGPSGNGNLFGSGDNNSAIKIPKKRGRPTKIEQAQKASKNTNAVQEVQQTNGQTSNSNALKDLLSEYKSVEPSNITVLPNQQTTPVDASREMVKNYFTGALVLVLVDALLPNFLLFIIKKYKPKAKVKIDDLQMTDDEQKALEPLMDAVIQNYVGTMPPEQALIMSLLMIYGSKAVPFLAD